MPLPLGEAGAKRRVRVQSLDPCKTDPGCIPQLNAQSATDASIGGNLPSVHPSLPVPSGARMSSSASSSSELSTATAMAQALRSRTVSSEELVRRAIERAEAWQGTSNAFSQLWAEEALA